MQVILGSAMRYAFKRIKHSSDSKPTLYSLLRKDNSLELPARQPLNDLLLWEAMDKRERFINPPTFFNIEGGATSNNPAPKDPFSLGTITHTLLKPVVKEDTLSVKKPGKVRG